MRRRFSAVFLSSLYSTNRITKWPPSMADTHVGDNEKIIREAPGRNRIQDGGFTNTLTRAEDIR